MRVTSGRAFSLVLAVVALTASASRPASAQWVSYNSDPRNILEGTWQSCPEPDGRYAERIYDHVVNGVPQFELHLGPRREFALYAKVQDDHREHDSVDNLLKPYRVLMEGSRAQKTWSVPSLKLTLTVSMGGGSTTDCEAWYVVLKPLEKTSH